MKRVFFFLTFIVSAWFLPQAQAGETLSATSPPIESLRLPSFSFFGFDGIDDPKLNEQYPEEELEKMIVAVRDGEKLTAASTSKEKKMRGVSFLIPLVLYRSRRLFQQAEWSVKDIQEGQRISRFVARLTNRPELEIFSSQQGAFRDGLINLRNWYAGLCRHNPSLAAMFFTLDDGPYYGYTLPPARFGQLRVLHSMALPGREEKFALMTDGKTKEPYFIGVLAKGGAIIWARRYTQHPDGEIRGAELFSREGDVIEGYGYVCFASTSGEGSRIFLDEKLNLRFYFVSW